MVVRWKKKTCLGGQFLMDMHELFQSASPMRQSFEFETKFAQKSFCRFFHLKILKTNINPLCMLLPLSLLRLLVPTSFLFGFFKRKTTRSFDVNLADGWECIKLRDIIYNANLMSIKLSATAGNRKLCTLKFWEIVLMEFQFL